MDSIEQLPLRQLLFFFCPLYAIIPKTANKEEKRLNYGKYVIGIRLLLLKEYFEANAGKNRLVTRKQLETFLEKGV